MADKEKVIKELESLRDICNAKFNMAIGNGKIAWAGYANAADDALVLLKEVLAKDNNAPCKRAYWVEETDRQRHWHCSNCGTVQGITSVMMKYCPECGYAMEEHPWAASGCGQAFCPGKDE